MAALCIHVLVPDGVFTRADDDGAVVFREGPAPTRGDIADVAARVEKRMRRWLRRRGLLDELHARMKAKAEGTAMEEAFSKGFKRPSYDKAKFEFMVFSARGR